MTETSAAKVAFAPAWPYLYKTPEATEIFAPYGKVTVFNASLTNDELKPLIEDCPTPGRSLLRVGGYALAVSYGLLTALWLGAWLFTIRDHGMSAVHRGLDPVGATVLDIAGAVLGVPTVVSLAVIGVGAVLNFIARKKWANSLAEAWERYGRRVVRTKELPEDRRQPVNVLGQRLDGALEQLDANDPVAKRLNDVARAAVARYIAYPVISEDARLVARSAVTDASVQKVREDYEAATAAEAAVHLEATNAVQAVVDYVEDAKQAAADQEIIELAKTIASGQ